MLYAILLTFAIAASYNVEALAQATAETPEEQSPSQPPSVELPAVVQPVHISEDETDKHFHLASKNFVANDLKVSAEEIRKAAASLKTYGEEADSDIKQGLTEFAKELDKLADEVEKGRVASVKRLHEAFARAELLLAELKNKKAAEAWARKNPVETGQALEASAGKLERAMTRTAYKDDGSLAKTLENMRAVSGKLTRSAELVPAEVTKAISDSSAAIDKFQASLDPEKKGSIEPPKKESTKPAKK